MPVPPYWMYPWVLLAALVAGLLGKNMRCVRTAAVLLGSLIVLKTAYHGGVVNPVGAILVDGTAMEIVGAEILFLVLFTKVRPPVSLSQVAIMAMLGLEIVFHVAAWVQTADASGHAAWAYYWRLSYSAWAMAAVCLLWGFHDAATTIVGLLDRRFALPVLRQRRGRCADLRSGRLRRG